MIGDGFPHYQIDIHPYEPIIISLSIIVHH